MFNGTQEQSKWMVFSRSLPPDFYMLIFWSFLVLFIFIPLVFIYLFIRTQEQSKWMKFSHSLFNIYVLLFSTSFLVLFLLIHLLFIYLCLLGRRNRASEGFPFSSQYLHSYFLIFPCPLSFIPRLHWFLLYFLIFLPCPLVPLGASVSCLPVVSPPVLFLLHISVATFLPLYSS